MIDKSLLEDQEEHEDSVDYKFTVLADRISELVGKWWFTAVSFILLIAWILYGYLVIRFQVSSWFTSTQWNFPLNTVTTVGEWFLEGFVLAAANRAERRNIRIQKRHNSILKLIEEREERIEQTDKNIEAILKKMAGIEEMIKNGNDLI